MSRNRVRRMTQGCLAVLVIVALASCTGRFSSVPPVQDAGPVALPFEPLPPQVYGNKVKNLLLGQPLTSGELSKLSADPTQLRGLIEGWMAQPAWQQRLLIFFKQAFQQTQITPNDLADQFPPIRYIGTYGPNNYQDMMRQLQEMFPRTALELVREGRPFTEVVTTTRFMLTPPLMAMLGYADATPKDDNQNPETSGNYILKEFPGYTVTQVDAPVPLAESIDPTSPNFMHWYTPTIPVPGVTGCGYPVQSSGAGALGGMAYLLFGVRFHCGNFTPMFTPADWNNWRMVNIRQPVSPSEPKTLFWDLPTLQTTQELVLQMPRVGFMTTPAFFANWPTNTSNEARVTTNQTMIVALGLAFDDRGVVVPVQSTAGDEHAQPGTSCYACHQTLDPMRDFFRQSYTYGYGVRDAMSADAGISPTAVFTALGSTPVSGHGIGDLARAIVAHPRFPIAWAQKLCRFANSTACSEDDPEFQRVVQAFTASNFNFNTLTAELLSSPLVTFASETKSADDNGVIISIDRHDTLCSSITNRLQLPDLCGLYGAPTNASMANVFQAVPGDGYVRGAEAPLIPTDPNLFFQSATESVCATLAVQLVDAGGTSRYRSAQPDAAVSDMVATVMGVSPADDRSGPLTAILNKHFAAAVATGVTKTAALQSTFMLACSSPQAVSSGL